MIECICTSGHVAVAKLTEPSGKPYPMKIFVVAIALSLGMFAVSPVFAGGSGGVAVKSTECSKEANAKGLKGKLRKRFLSKCRESKK